jgi:hypothetical protein
MLALFFTRLKVAPRGLGENWGGGGQQRAEQASKNRKEWVVFVRDIFEKPETEKNKNACAVIIFCFNFEL